MHNSNMSVYQVMNTRSRNSEKHYELVQSSPDLAAEELETNDQTPAYFGSESIVRLAIALEDADYVPFEVAFADAYLERIDPESVSEEGEVFLNCIRNRSFDQSMALLASSLEGSIVESLSMRGKAERRGAMLRILQDGIIEISSAARSADTENDLRRALNAA